MGHVHTTRAALTRFGLNQVWWLVSPGNPLKAHPPALMALRLQAARALMQHPKVKVTDLEERLNTRYTALTLMAMRKRYPGVRFVWLMGADNLAQFDHWQNWRWIMDHIPVGVIARPGDRISARLSKAARVYRHARLSGHAAAQLGQMTAPAWCFINVPMSPLSSTAIRANGNRAPDAAARSVDSD
jgi:nicotinate-nucleotide adenylyltransferase